MRVPNRIEEEGRVIVSRGEFQLRKGLTHMALMMSSILITLLTLELIARIFYEPPRSEITAFSLSSSGFYKSDHELGWLPRINQRGVHNKQGSFSSTFTTNSRGLRDKEYFLEKPTGITRIVVVGDSFTWGFGVNDEEIYTQKLESLLPNTEVINLGVTAYGLTQEINYFQREGILYQPDVLIVGFTLNDIYPERNFETTKTKLITNRRDHIKNEDANTSVFLRIKNFLGRSSVIYRFIVDRINTNKRLVKMLVSLGVKDSLVRFENLDTNLMPALRDYPEDLAGAFANTKTRLRQLKRFTSELDIRLVIAVVPSRQSVNKRAFEHSIAYTEFDDSDFDLDKPYRLLQEFAETENIEIISPLDEFHQAHEEGRMLYLLRDMHFSKAGHDLFAHVIAKYLEERRTRSSTRD